MRNTKTILMATLMTATFLLLAGCGLGGVDDEATSTGRGGAGPGREVRAATVHANAGTTAWRSFSLYPGFAYRIETRVSSSGSRNYYMHWRNRYRNTFHFSFAVRTSMPKGTSYRTHIKSGQSKQGLSFYFGGAAYRQLYVMIDSVRIAPTDSGPYVDRG